MECMQIEWHLHQLQSCMSGSSINQIIKQQHAELGISASRLHEVYPIMPVLPTHGAHDVFPKLVQSQSVWTCVHDAAIAYQARDSHSLLSLDLASNVAVDEVMLAANCSVPRLVLCKMVVVSMISATICRCNDVEDILISFQKPFPP